jgi:zinc protease
VAYFLQAFHAPAASHDDFFPVIVLDAVLGGAKGMGIFGGSANNRSNRLYRALVETEITVDVNSSFGPNIDPGLFTISATLAPESTHQQVEDAIWAEIERVQAEGVTAAELRKAIQQTRAQFAYSSESTTYQAYWLGFSEVVTSLAWLDTWMERLAAVTSDDVQRVAQHYCRRDGQTVGWYVPEDTWAADAADDGEEA